MIFLKKDSKQISACMICRRVLEIFFIGAWRSLEARLLWEQEVGGSNPLAPTNKFSHLDQVRGLHPSFFHRY